MGKNVRVQYVKSAAKNIHKHLIVTAKISKSGKLLHHCISAFVDECTLKKAIKLLKERKTAQT
ncbi:MAG TPA: hypothetical protein VMS94_00010 [Acidobacteriota bacterium]|jgi:hypothetical protein|nr:hypothetical protein [Acidobacteriota bacterium]